VPSLIVATWIGFATGCATVPDIGFLKHTYATQSAALRTAWGPIPEATRAAITTDLKRHAGNPDIVDRQAAIEEAVAGTALVTGNRVELLLDGPATYEAMFTAIRQARSTINVESYIIDDGEVGQRLADLLLARRAAGVEVNVMYDGVGAFKTKEEYFERLRRGGVRVVQFNPVNALAMAKPWKLNHRDHRKLTVVDGRIAFLGGINIDDVYASSSFASGGSGGGGSSSGGKNDEKRSGWRDTDIRVEGPVVADFQRLFLDTWEQQHGPPLDRERHLPPLAPAGHEIVRAIASSPADQFSATYLALMGAIINAQRQIYITNAYFVPDPQLVEELIAAARRGVDVRLVLPSTTDSRSAAYAAHSHYTELLNGGVKIYERKAALLHAKTAVIDSVWSCVGSANLDWRSAVDNNELNAVILSTDFAARMIHAYELDEAQSDEIQLDGWRERPLRERIKEGFFHLFGRLL
jgi:cardiolipin synthase